MTAAMSQEYSASYNSFSGPDIHASFAGVHIGDLQAISYTVTREKAPIYTMGSPNPRSFSRGKRGIAGSFIFITFDRPTLLYKLREEGLKFWARDEEITQSSKRRNTAGALEGGDLRRDDAEVRHVLPWYEDQIPPFHVVLTGANEYGHQMRMTINGVEILNAGTGVSIDDITIDQQMTFVATEITPWRPGAFLSPQANLASFAPAIIPGA